jgi:hypothetical protein
MAKRNTGEMRFSGKGRAATMVDDIELPIGILKSPNDFSYS